MRLIQITTLVSLMAALPLFGGTTYLLPSGGDDTDNLQTALNSCIGASNECVVQLSAGTFRTRQLAVRNFRGTLRGAGKTSTVILAEKGLVITNPDHWSENLPGPTNTWPLLITFVDGSINLQGFTVRMLEPKPTTGFRDPWFSPVDTVYWLWGAITITASNNQPMSSSVNEVGFEGIGVDPSVGTPLAPYNNIAAYSVQPFLVDPSSPPSVWFLPRGVHSLTSSDVTGSQWGAAVLDVVDFKCTVGGNAAKGNRFDNVAAAILFQDLDNSSVEVSYNRVSNTQLVGVYAAQGASLYTLFKASDLAIHHNDLQMTIDSFWNSGIQIWNNMYTTDPYLGATLRTVIASNTIEVNYSSPDAWYFDKNGISLVNVSGASVQANRIKGVGLNAIYVGGDLSSDLCSLAGNDLEQFQPYPGQSDILLDATTHRCTVLGAGNSTVTDLGTANVIIGPHRQAGGGSHAARPHAPVLPSRGHSRYRRP